MSIKEIEKFYIEVKKNKTLKEELESIKKRLLKDRLSQFNAEDFIEEGLIPLARRYGMIFSLDDLMDYASKSHAQLLKQANMLSEEELEAVSGGRSEAEIDILLFLHSLGI